MRYIESQSNMYPPTRAPPASSIPAAKMQRQQADDFEQHQQDLEMRLLAHSAGRKPSGSKTNREK